MPEPASPSERPQSAIRHGFGFLVSGLVAFAVDAVVLEAGVRLAGLDNFVARLIAISVAMVAGWLAHRRWTFRVTAKPSVQEFIRYATSAWMAAGVNYGAFVAILLFAPITPRLIALVAASAISMILSYITMRYGVFYARRS